MQRGEVEVAGFGSRNILVTLAGASFGLGALLTVVVFARATWTEFRWLCPIAAAALNVGLVALGAQRSSAPARHRASATGQAITWTLLRPTSWRAAIALAGKRLRMIRGWPWLVILCGALTLLLCVATWIVFERRPPAVSPNARTVVTLACGAALALAFVTLIAERFFAAEASRSAAGVPLAVALRALLFVTLAGAASAALFAWSRADARWLALVAALLPAAIACEFVLRAVLMWFSPPGVGSAPLDVVNSAIGRLLMRPLASSGTLGETMRHRFGIDLRQSWVIRSTLRMAPVACVTLVVVAWLLSGVSVLQPDQRAVYERFGAPAAVWQPGPHVGLPWPFGRARLLENGAVHQVVVSSAGGDAGVANVAAPLIHADARTPEQLDRLWDVAHPWETTQVIAGGNGKRQNFEIVSADVRLDYRIRQDDAAARASQYRFADAPALIRAIASREVVRYLASHALDALVQTRQTVIADAIRQSVQQQFDTLGSGIEVVAVVIESVHPPAGASSAWHNVQAAQIRAAASVAQARGLAATVVGSAQETAAASIDTASAAAAETLSAAQARQTTFTADVAARQAGGPAFPFEYYPHALQKGLQNANLTVIDDRLVGGNRATIDLRAYNTGDAAGAKRLY